MKKFEYLVKEIDVKGWFARKIDILEFSQTLNDLGKEGWELIDKTPIGELGTETKIICVFKRELA